MNRIRKFFDWLLKRDIQLAMLRELHLIRIELERQGKVTIPQPIKVGSWTPYEPLKPLQPLGSHK